MKNNMVLVIHEYDYGDKDKTVIGVATTVERAEYVIDKYYGSEQKEISYQDIREGNLEYSKMYEVKDYRGKFYKIKITLEWFELDDI